MITLYFIFLFFRLTCACDFRFTQFWKTSCLDHTLSNDWMMAVAIATLGTFGFFCGFALHYKFKVPWTYGFLSDFPVAPTPPPPPPVINAPQVPSPTPSVCSYFHL
ncbi:E3 RID-beta [Simian adenovirus 48]|uniref:E3 RID-beta n=1 Tax=Simian adenovirus 48 TaxID=995021 RepID=A0A9W3NB57_9ADEN|nr:E3 RID-beta [Simian adenovirus 48]